MVHLVGSTLPYSKLPFERALQGIAQAGYQYVSFGLPHAGTDVPHEHDQNAVSGLQRLFDRYKLQPAMLIGTEQFAPGQPLERARQRLQTAKMLGIKEVVSLGTCAYRKFPDEPLTEPEAALLHRQFIEQFRSIAAEAEALDVMVTLRPHGGNTGHAEKLIDTVHCIGSEHVRVSYDPCNVHFYEGLDAAEDLLSVAGLVYSLAIKDQRGGRANPDFPMPGTGDVDYTAMFKQLKASGTLRACFVERVDGYGTEDSASIDLHMEITRRWLAQQLIRAGFQIET